MGNPLSSGSHTGHLCQNVKNVKVKFFQFYRSTPHLYKGRREGASHNARIELMLGLVPLEYTSQARLIRMDTSSIAFHSILPL